jgi:hypothetical protein
MTFSDWVADSAAHSYSVNKPVDVGEKLRKAA